MQNRATDTNPAWSTDKYYLLAKKGVLATKSYGLQKLIYQGKNASSILDIGCGEGTRLSLVAKENKGTGVDISKKAIAIAKKQYPQFKFIQADVTKKLPFNSETFDLVYSAFVLEHISEPENMIKEAIRVLKKTGTLILIAPNYGAPNRVSPVFEGSRLKTSINRFIEDFYPPTNSKLNWNHVTPVKNYYEQDLDTVIEPYLGSLKSFLEYYGMKNMFYHTLWEEELPNAKLHQKLFRLLAALHIPPFTMWGPQFIIISKKSRKIGVKPKLQR